MIFKVHVYLQYTIKLTVPQSCKYKIAIMDRLSIHSWVSAGHSHLAKRKLTWIFAKIEWLIFAGLANVRCPCNNIRILEC